MYGDQENEMIANEIAATNKLKLLQTNQNTFSRSPSCHCQRGKVLVDKKVVFCHFIMNSPL